MAAGSWEKSGWDMTAREGRVSLGNDKKMFLNVVKAEEPCEYTKIHHLV